MRSVVGRNVVGRNVVGRNVMVADLLPIQRQRSSSHDVRGLRRAAEARQQRSDRPLGRASAGPIWLAEPLPRTLKPAKDRRLLSRVSAATEGSRKRAARAGD